MSSEASHAPSAGDSWREAGIAALAAAGIAASLLMARFGASAASARIPLAVVVVAGGAPLLYDLARSLLAREIGADVLAGLSIVVSAAMGQLLVAAIIVLMLSGGAALERNATRRASQVLEALA